MLTVVVDASAIAAILFVEPDGPLISARIGDRNMIAPRLIRAELVNVGLKKWRADEAARAAIATALRSFPSLGVREVDIVLVDVFDLAMTTGLTAYDASYVWLARQLGTELITLDREQAKAATTA